MVFVLFFACIILFSSIVCIKYNRELCEILPTSLGMIILLLYFLAFFNHMWLLDYILLLTLVLSFYIILKEKLYKQTIESIFNFKSIIVIIILILGILLLKNRGLSTYDEYSFWGVDIKSLYFLEGYAKKGLNCANAYGDYPPGCQLLASYFMHTIGSYNEGFGYSAYFLIYMSYFAPLYKGIPKKIYLFPIYIIFPFIAFCFSGSTVFFSRSPDFIMGVIYGCSLVQILDKKEDLYKYVSIAISLSILPLIKNVGIIYYLFSIILLFITSKKKEKIISCLIPIVIIASWFIFTKFNARTTYITESTVNSLQNGFTNSQTFKLHWKELAYSFGLHGFSPLNNGIANLGIGFIPLIILFFIISYLAKNKTISLFLLITGLIELLILFFSIEIMFVDEYQNFLDNMILVYGRYGCPYTMSSFMIICYILTNNNDNNPFFWLLLFVFALFTTPIETMLTRYVYYRNNPMYLEKNIGDYPSSVKDTVNYINSNYEDSRTLIILDTNDYNDWMSIRYLCTPKCLFFFQNDQLSYDYFSFYVTQNNIELIIIKNKNHYYKFSSTELEQASILLNSN